MNDEQEGFRFPSGGDGQFIDKARRSCRLRVGKYGVQKVGPQNKLVERGQEGVDSLFSGGCCFEDMIEMTRIGRTRNTAFQVMETQLSSHATIIC